MRLAIQRLKLSGIGKKLRKAATTVSVLGLGASILDAMKSTILTLEQANGKDLLGPRNILELELMEENVFPVRKVAFPASKRPSHLFKRDMCTLKTTAYGVQEVKHRARVNPKAYSFKNALTSTILLKNRKKYDKPQVHLSYLTKG